MGGITILVYESSTRLPKYKILFSEKSTSATTASYPTDSENWRAPGLVLQLIVKTQPLIMIRMMMRMKFFIAS